MMQSFVFLLICTIVLPLHGQSDDQRICNVIECKLVDGTTCNRISTDCPRCLTLEIGARYITCSNPTFDGCQQGTICETSPNKTTTIPTTSSPTKTPNTTTTKPSTTNLTPTTTSSTTTIEPTETPEPIETTITPISTSTTTSKPTTTVPSSASILSTSLLSLGFTIMIPFFYH